ncbi:esterase/lipase family protein [Gemmatimonadota bacterium]
MKAKPFAAFLLALAVVQAVGAGAAAQEGPPVQVADSLSPHYPVLLVPGWMSRAWDLSALRERFLRDGWPVGEAVILEFADPVGSNLDHAGELEVAIQALREESGAPQVDLLVHSMGGLALWLLLREKGDELPIRRVVFLGSPLQGTLTAHLAWGVGGEEMRPGSPILEELAQGPGPEHWVEALTIRTPLDLTVFPVSGATLPGMGDRVVCCPTHQGLLDHEETYRVARDFFLHGHRRDGEDGAGR